MENEYLSISSITSEPTRSLTSSEINQLQRNQNNVLPPLDWSNCIRVLKSSTFSTDNIRNVTFGGNVILGSFTNEKIINVDGVLLPSGLYHSTILNSCIADGALVSRTVLLSNCVLGKGAAAVGCGRVYSRGEQSSYGNGQSISIAVETGGREVMLWADMTLETASKIAGNRSDIQTIKTWENRVKKLTNMITFNKTLLGKECVLLNCPKIEDVFIGSGALVEGSTVVNSSILSSSDSNNDPHATTSIVGGCYIENSIVQWGCACETMSIVSDSFMCATSHIEKHGKLLESILGPCSGVAEGEVTASLVGPFVGFHHQSLLIACYWPAGRGNIGYGANVGSNHTGKAPDQEIWPGEGLFFGLATAIKFPSNFTKSPYTLIATGVTTLPQRVEMPFSLINSPGEIIQNISPAMNEILPGWILSDNLYMILRNETKFLKRGKKATTLSQRTGHVNYDNEALRPSIINMMIEAREKLNKVKIDECQYLDSKNQGVWTSKEIQGLGKNYMKESTRLKGIQTYTDFILYYCVRSMWRALASSGISMNELLHGKPPSSNSKSNTAIGVLNMTSTIETEERGTSALDEWYDYARELTLNEMKLNHMNYTVEDGLLKYVELQERFAHDVLVSKQKDDKRGPKVIDGYKDAHGTAENNDNVVAKAREDAVNERRNIMNYLNSKCSKL
jgi:NDP-sugar pyrophosphorylase family protein